jgi:hypothetical protein
MYTVCTYVQLVGACIILIKPQYLQLKKMNDTVPTLWISCCTHASMMSVCTVSVHALMHDSLKVQGAHIHTVSCYDCPCSTLHAHPFVFSQTG